MKSPITLNPEEQALRDDIKHMLCAHPSDEELDNLAQKAHKLHTMLLERGVQPIHHKYMLRNRKMEPTNVLFYRHVHPIEDLLSFIDDPDSTTDHADRSLGKTFHFPVYSRKRMDTLVFEITKTEFDWEVTLGKSKWPTVDSWLAALHYSMSVSYPFDIDRYFHLLWNDATCGKVSPEDVQRHFYTLSSWVSCVERSTPEM